MQSPCLHQKSARRSRAVYTYFMHLRALVLVLLLSSGCALENSWTNADLGGTWIFLQPANVALDGQQAASVTLTVRQKSGAPIPNLQVTFAADTCSLQMPKSATTDANGRLTAHVAGCKPGSHGVAAALSNGQFSTPAPVRTAVNFFTPVPKTEAMAVGTALNVTAQAGYADDAPRLDYAGTVHFVSSDPAAELPGDYVFKPADRGAVTLVEAARLYTAGTQTITALDTSSGEVLGVQTFLVQSTGTRTVRISTVASSVQAGAPQTLTVQVTDSQGVVDARFVGTVQLSSSAAVTGLPATITLGAADAGSLQIANVKFTAVGSALLTAQADGIAGATTALQITAAPAATLRFAALSSPKAGVSQLVTVTAQDAFGNTATDLSALQLVSSDPAASLPKGAVPASSPGIWNFPVTFYTAGNQFLQATQVGTAGLTALLTNLLVTPAAALAVHVTLPTASVAGAKVAMQVAIEDTYGNVVPSYVGQVLLAVTGNANSFPAALSFTNADRGVVQLPNLTLPLAGITRVDAADSLQALRSDVHFITVSPAAVAQLQLTTRSPSPYLQASSVTVTARDAYANVVTNYLGTVHFSSTDGSAQLPADVTLSAQDKGSKTLPNAVTFAGLGAQRLTATDTPNGLQGNCNVTVHKAVQIAASKMGSSACALFDDGLLKCWGNNDNGQLGLGDTTLRGPHAADLGEGLPYVYLGTGRTVQQVGLGNMFGCALLDNRAVKCWGVNNLGQIGLGDASQRGSDPGQMGDALPAVSLGTGRTVTQLFVGYALACALLDTNELKCWGSNSFGALGSGNGDSYGGGPNQMGDALPVVSLGTGRTARAAGSGRYETCAVLDDQTLKCWGYNAGGELGLGDSLQRGAGPNQMGDNLPTVNLGTGRTARAYDAGAENGCALLDNGVVKCWGTNLYGIFGYGDFTWRGGGPNQMGDNLPAVPLGTGRTATAIAALGTSIGVGSTCALLDTGAVKCWGVNSSGELGIGDTANRGDDPNEMGDLLPTVDLGTGRTAVSLVGGDSFACVLLDNAQMKCWGDNSYGQLGMGGLRGYGKAPGQMGDNLPVVRW